MGSYIEQEEKSVSDYFDNFAKNVTRVTFFIKNRK